MREIKFVPSKFTPDDLRKEAEAIQAAFESLSSLDAAGRERARQYLESLLSRERRYSAMPDTDPGVPF